MTGAWFWVLLIFTGTAGVTALLTRTVLQVLRQRAILDHPNERSSHARPTPRGGGIAVVAVLLPSWLLIAIDTPAAGTSFWLTLAGIAALAGLSWIDDLRNLSAALRVACHAVIVAIVLAALPADAMVFQGLLPPLADRIAAGLLWIWFINLFNFMDGIDGISGVEAIAIGLGLFLVATTGSTAGPATLRTESLLALAMAGTALGFLLWNWHPARLFLGDVGSVPLGFALGWLLLQAAIAGHWAAALILPLYYLADATITLARRAARGARIWQAHREHFYQQAAARGRDHAAISRDIAIANIALIALAIVAERASTGLKLAVIAAALAIVALLLLRLSGAWRRARP
jgi:UDP-N-acetylmuramyl pentapeptide phosphotransferase/UDP-N-acetylglucosamine-1-phosphate transferase